MKTRRGKTGILLILFLCAVLALLVLAFGMIDRIFDHANAGNDGMNDGAGGMEVLYYNAKAYVKKDSLETVLFVGLDTDSEIAAMDSAHLADFLMLAVIDHDLQSVRFLHINRDTMAYINQLDHADAPSATLYTQLARGHIFGSSETVRSHNTVRAVERLLYDIEIDHYVTMTMGAVRRINDAVGGITLPLLADFSHVDAAYTEGAEVTLLGDFALTYIRARGEMEDSTNLARMKRQKQYMEQLLTVYLESISAQDALHAEIAADTAPYLHTDLTVHQITRLGERISAYAFSGAEPIAGEAVLGEEFIEYYVDEQALQELVLALFYRVYEE